MSKYKSNGIFQYLLTSTIRQSYQNIATLDGMGLQQITVRLVENENAEKKVKRILEK